MKLPRTLADFANLDRWVWNGQTDEEIFARTKKEWRSEVITLAGRLHCAECLQTISVAQCLECGQTIQRDKHE